MPIGWPSHGPRGRHDWATYIERGYVGSFRDTVREMPDVDVPVDESRRTMLMEVLAYAGGEPWLEIVTLLIGAGADVNRPDSSGFTPLMGAARAGHSGMVEFLLLRGARHDAVDSSDETAQMHAAEFQHQREIAPILQRVRGKADPA